MLPVYELWTAEQQEDTTYLNISNTKSFTFSAKCLDDIAIFACILFYKILLLLTFRPFIPYSFTPDRQSVPSSLLYFDPDGI
jgi:hypothetical protein